MTIWQSPVSGRLHCHVLTWIDPKHKDILLDRERPRFCDGVDVHAQPWGRDIGYFTRARLPNGPPEYEARQRWSRVNSNPIRGVQLSLSDGLEAIVEKHRADKETVRSRPIPAQPVVIPPLPPAGPAQLVLFGHELPALPPPALDLVAERKRRGLSQAALGGLIGLRQSHVANVERGHDRLSPARLRVLRHILDGLPVAA